MLYTFLITIVFIAELIIMSALMVWLLMFDKEIIRIDKYFTKIKPDIADISELGRKISEQWTELAEDFVEKLKVREEDMMARQLSKVLIGILLWKINSKAIRQFRRSKFARNLRRGFALVQSMV